MLDYVRATVALRVAAADVAGALTIAWDAFRDAAADDLTGWEAPAASAEVQPDLREPRRRLRVCGRAARPGVRQVKMSFITLASLLLPYRCSILSR